MSKKAISPLLDTSPKLRYKPYMKKSVLILAIAILILSACTVSWPSSQPTSAAPGVPQPTLAPTVPPLPTATPTPTPSQSLTDADYALFIGDYQTALSLYQTAYDQTQESTIREDALLGLGKTYIQLEDFNSAITYLNQLLNQYPQTTLAAPANYFLGECYDAVQNYGMAAASYSAYITANPGIIDAYIMELEGDALANNGDLTGAINAYTNALAANPPGNSDSLNLKIGNDYLSLGQNDSAVRTFMALYDSTQSDYTKATANLLAGKAYLAMGVPEQTYARYQDSVSRYPRSYDSYSQLVELVNNNQPVNDLNRGIVDYYAGQYGYAVDALTRYINSDANHEGSAHYYLALSYRANDQVDSAISEFDALIRDHPSDPFWNSAWDEKAWTLWYDKDKYAEGAQVLIDFVSRVPTAPEAPSYLFEAARIYERGGLLLEAATTWERVLNDYPGSDQAYRALFLAGVTYYRQNNYDYALTVFQKYLVLTSNPDEQAAADFWIGKINTRKNDLLSANKAYQAAAAIDSTGYYSIRAREVLQNQSPLPASANTRTNYDLATERINAASWIREKFNVPSTTDLNSLEDFSSNPAFLQAESYYAIGQYEKASDQFDALRQQFSVDAVNSFRLLGHLMDMNLYRQAILTSRQILDLVFGSDTATLEAPQYFTHIRFGFYYRDLVTEASSQYKIDPLLFLSIARQESLFEGHAVSSAGAIGVVQMMPATGEETAKFIGWPNGFTTSDLYRPYINIPLGASYLARQRDYFGGDTFEAIAAYNGGAGNVQIWMQLANNDPDLFLEIIRFDETRNYLEQIVEFYSIYKTIYSIP